MHLSAEQQKALVTLALLGGNILSTSIDVFLFFGRSMTFLIRESYLSQTEIMQQLGEVPAYTVTPKGWEAVEKYKQSVIDQLSTHAPT
ncbi:MAG: hypothetical protein WC823_05365 [Parcubacteria group bacterium]|jgi:hypothetical protein